MKPALSLVFHLFGSQNTVVNMSVPSLPAPTQGLMLTHKATALHAHLTSHTLRPWGTQDFLSHCSQQFWVCWDSRDEADSTHPGVPAEPAQPQLTWLPLEVRVVLLEFLLLLVQFLLEVLKFLLVLFLFFFWDVFFRRRLFQRKKRS